MRKNHGFFRATSLILAAVLVLSGLPGTALGTEGSATSPSEIQTEPTIPSETIPPEAGPECPAFSIFCQGQPEPGSTLTFSAEPEMEGILYFVSLDGSEWTALESSTYAIPDGTPGPHILLVMASVGDQASSNTLELSYNIPEPETTGAVTMSPDGGTFFLKGEALSITLTCETEGAEIYYAMSTDGESYNEFVRYDGNLTLEAGFGTRYLKAYAQKVGSFPGPETVRCFSERTPAGLGVYFGQLHAHSLYSDGSLSVGELYSRAAETMDFFAVTDHSNSLDAALWSGGRQAAQAATIWDFVGLYGYEMTWQETKALGHLNVFNTSGYESRDQVQYTDIQTTLPNFYGSLASQPGAIGQFNHPGTDYGSFQNFGHYSEAADAAIPLLELGDGLDITYYTQALDKGWHVAPVCNQDYHGQWQDNGSRTAILAGSLTEEGLSDAIANRRVYATEDPDLTVTYTLNGYAMGSRLDALAVGDTVTLHVSVSDPTDGDSGTAEVIAENGTVLSEKALDGGKAVFTVPAGHDYYFLRITQSDGNQAVTAPVWVDGTEDVGIASLTAETQTPFQGQAFHLTLGLFNKEYTDLLIDKITCSIGGEVLHTATQIDRVAAGATAVYTFPITYFALGSALVQVTVTGTLNGSPRVYQESLTLNFRRGDTVTQILVDGSHQNAGLSDIQNLTAIAAGKDIGVMMSGSEITKEMLYNASVLLVCAPSIPFDDRFLSLAADFVRSGGSVVVCGQSDSLDTASLHTAAELNRLLEAVGVTLRIHDDQARDSLNNNGSSTDLRLTGFNTDSKWYTQLSQNQFYCQSMGCTVDPGSGTWLVRGYASTHAVDADMDGLGGAGTGLAVLLACEETPYGGTVFAAGGVFFADSYTEESDNIREEPDGNRTFSEGLLRETDSELPLSTIAEASEPGELYRVRGYVTAGTAISCNTFPSAIYIQDATGGIAVMPFQKTGVEIGTPLEITGYLDIQNGNRVLGIISYEELSAKPYSYVPEVISHAEAADRLGKLVQVEGEVTEVTYTPDGSGVSSFQIKDSYGDTASVFIEDGIASGTTGGNRLAAQVRKGNTVRAVGIVHVHTDGSTVVRVRDCDEVAYIPPAPYAPDPAAVHSGRDGALLQGLLIAAILAAAIVLHLKKQKER